MKSKAEEKVFYWTHDTILLLLVFYEKKEEDFRNGMIKKEKIWNDIAKKFKMKGYAVQGKDLYRKFRNLTSIYLSKEDLPGKTERDRRKWPYFKQFEIILCKDLSFNTDSLNMMCSSISSETQISRPSPSSQNDDLETFLESEHLFRFSKSDNHHSY